MILGRTDRTGAVLGLAALLLSPQAAANEPLGVDPSDPRFAGRPELVARLAATPHGYFRFVNGAFAAETCRLFSADTARLPDVNLHGDAHVEQYAVTNLGRGLSDFDDCTRGKAVIDLVRFSASLLLAAREKGWAKQERRFLDAFLEGYRDALGGGRLSIPMPKVASRARSGFRWDRAASLLQANRLIDLAPLPNDAFADGVARFEELVRFGRELPDAFFRVKRMGALTMGVGSALDEKYLMILEGRTQEAGDDLIVEAKQIRDLAGNPCIRTDVGASRVLDGQRLIAYEPFAYAAVVAHGGKHFWMHDWTDDYHEATIGTAIHTPEDLRQIAYDVGVQMGRAHPKRPDGSANRALERASLAALNATEGRVRAASRELAARTEAAWASFRDGAGAKQAGHRP